MGSVLTYFAHLGIVRVLSVPIGMAVALWILWTFATPPEWHDDEERTPRKA